MRLLSPRHLQLAGLATTTSLLLLFLFAWPTNAPVAMDLDPSPAYASASTSAKTVEAEQSGSQRHPAQWIDATLASAKKKQQMIAVGEWAPPLAIDASPVERTASLAEREPITESAEVERDAGLASPKLAEARTSAAQTALSNAGDTNLNFSVGMRADGTTVPILPAAEVEEEVVIDFGAASAWATEDDRQRSGDALMDEVEFDLGTLDYTISFEPPRPSLLGLTLIERQHIEIYVRPGMSKTEIIDVIGHEIGHAIDHILVSTDERLQWRIARGIEEDSAWWPTDMASDLDTPAGDFAECVGWAVTGSSSYSAWGACDALDPLIRELMND